jgi:hypothetical protein
MTHEKLNELMFTAHAKAGAHGGSLLECPVGDCDWSTENIEGGPKYLRRHLVAFHSGA